MRQLLSLKQIGGKTIKKASYNIHNRLCLVFDDETFVLIESDPYTEHECQIYDTSMCLDPSDKYTDLEMLLFLEVIDQHYYEVLKEIRKCTYLEEIEANERELYKRLKLKYEN